MKHRHKRGRRPEYDLDHPTFPRLSFRRRARFLRWLRRPPVLAFVAVVAVSTGSVAAWHVGALSRPGGQAGVRGHARAAAVSLPPDTPFATADRDERASRGTPRSSPSSAAATPPATGTSAPATTPAPTRHRSTASRAPDPAPAAPTTPASPTPSATVSGGYVAVGPSFSGEASFYGNGDGTDGGPTASGEIFDANALTAAHPSLPFGTLLNVCYQGRCVVVRINDRGPFVGGRILDLSAHAADVIGMTQAGVGYVTATPVQPVK